MSKNKLGNTLRKLIHLHTLNNYIFRLRVMAYKVNNQPNNLGCINLIVNKKSSEARMASELSFAYMQKKLFDLGTSLTRNSHLCTVFKNLKSAAARLIGRRIN